jgi:general L-amino acid transport system substrate-binding protein
MVLGMIIAACFGSGPAPAEAEPTEAPAAVEEAAPAEAEAAAPAEEATEAPAEEVAAAPAETEAEAPAAQGEATLAAVQARGSLKCGAGAGAAPGFAFITDDGSWEGFNVDFCKVIAAAALGDAEAVEPVVTTGTTRFPMLQSGEVDVLSNNTTWTSSRDTALGFNFAPTVFYDGQGMMVRVDSGIEKLADLDGASVCVATGTTTEKNLADVMRKLDIEYEAVTFEDTGDVTRSAFEGGRCDAYTTDASGLISGKVLFDDPDSVKILPEIMSKEPLGPLVRHGDDNWFDIVKWSVFCTIQAEELGITSENVDEMLASDDPVVLNTLGVEGEHGAAMGLNNDFCYQVVKQVGNFGEIFDRSLGPGTQFNLERGVNALWTNGGLMYSPPFR